jgi:Flp pilus assembly protein TadD
VWPFYFFVTEAFRVEISQHDRWQVATKKYYELGALPLFNAQRYEEALNETNRCLSIVPDFVPALNLRGKTYAMLNNYKEAESNFKKAISLTPISPEGYRNMGFICLIQGKVEAARRYLSIKQTRYCLVTKKP